ncbi:MAG: hypothetical protein M1826_003877 [Phylliscum demangeonii]|nr:MAG: hypothetical protein M1826_003877 [Phylliscum demangeonii]
MATLGEWLMAGPAFAQPCAPSQPDSTQTKAYNPPEAGIEDTFRPFALCRSSTLPDRMLADLPNLLQQQPHVDRPMTVRLQTIWDEARQDAIEELITHARDVGTMWLGLLRFCQKFHRELCETQLRQSGEVDSDEVNVRMDKVLQLGEEARVAIDFESDLADAHLQDDLNHLTGQRWLGWNGVDGVRGAQAILLKLALWMGSNHIRWGVIGTERQYRIVRRGHAMIDSKPYPYLEISDAIAIDSGAPAILTVSFVNLIPCGGHVISLERVQPQAHDMASCKGAGSDREPSPTTSPTPSRTMSMTASDASDTWLEDAATRTITIQSRLGRGAVGQCYQGILGLGTAVVLKVAHSGQEPVLEQEAFLYEHYLSTSAAVFRRRPIAPTFHGYFSCGVYRNMVLSYTGQSLSSFGQLTLDAKTHLFDQVQTLHALGLGHGDLEPGNVTRDDDGRTTIIDFSHSYLHDCDRKKRQLGYCEELRSLAGRLGLAGFS